MTQPINADGLHHSGFGIATTTVGRVMAAAALIGALFVVFAVKPTQFGLSVPRIGTKTNRKTLILQHQADGLFNQALEGGQPRRANRPIHHAVVAGQRHAHDRGNRQSAVLDHGARFTRTD
ncbi:MAG: hypothetical protein RLZZ157_793 [Pseudomonadota bacterium]